MPLLRKIIIKKGAGQRGTEDKEAVLELARSEWDQIREKYAAETDQQGELIAHFNAVATGSEIGDSLFGDNAGIDEFCDLINGLDEATQTAFVVAWNEAFESKD